jgi:hypothetical protein
MSHIPEHKEQKNIPQPIISNLQGLLGNLTGFLKTQGVSFTEPPKQQLTPPGALTSDLLAPPVNLFSGFQSSPSVAPGIQGLISSFMKSQQDKIKKEEKELDVAKVTQVEQQKTFFQRLQDIMGIRGERPALEEAQGIPGLTKELSDLQGQIEAKELGLRRELEAIQKTPGGTVEGTREAMRAVERRGTAELADLAIIQSAKTRNLSVAQGLVDKNIQLRLEPLQDQLKFDEFFLSRADEVLSKAEKNLLSSRIKEEERIFDFLKEEMKEIYKNAIDAAEQGAPTDVVQRILQSNSREDAARLASPYLGLLERQREERLRAGRVVPGGAVPGSETPDKPLTINQIEQFRRSYGWTPPFGFSAPQLKQYMDDNPGATPEELQAGINSVVSGGATTTPTITSDEAITSMMASITDQQLKALKKKADKAGISSFFKGKKTDVKDYLNSIKPKIQESLDNGFTIEDIISFLTA